MPPKTPACAQACSRPPRISRLFLVHLHADLHGHIFGAFKTIYTHHMHVPHKHKLAVNILYHIQKQAVNTLYHKQKNWL